MRIKKIPRPSSYWGMGGCYLAFFSLTLMTLVGCSGKATTPIPIETPPPGGTNTVDTNLPSVVVENLKRLEGTNPYFSEVVGPFAVNGKAHYYQVVRYNVAQNRAPGSKNDYSGAQPNWSDAATLASHSHYTPSGGAALMGHLGTLTSSEERDFLQANLANKVMDKTDYRNGKNNTNGLINALRGLALGGTLELTPTRAIPKKVNWVTGEQSDYENWARNTSSTRVEPGGDNTEPYLQVNSSADITAYSNTDGWNDYNGSDNQTTGYLVEFE